MLDIAKDATVILFIQSLIKKDLYHLVVMQRPNEAPRVDPSFISFNMYTQDGVVFLEAFGHNFHLIPPYAIVSNIQMHQVLILLEALRPSLGCFSCCIELFLVISCSEEATYGIERNIKHSEVRIVYQVFSNLHTTLAEDLIVRDMQLR